MLLKHDTLKTLPVPLLHDLEGVKGYNEAAFIEAHQQPAVTSVRLHPVKQSPVFEGAERVGWCNEGRYLSQRPVFTTDPLYHAGAYYVQEASSMLLDHVLRTVLPERNNLRVLDLCGAPGGKSTLIASLLGKDSLLLSNEVIRTRASILEENMTRWGYMNTWVCSNDPKDIGKLQGYFDVMVVDAPCSGSGLFRKDQRALDEWSEANVALCSQRQQRILADVWPALKEDGILVYATCSYSPQEDEQILDWLKQEWAIESLQIPVEDAWGVTEVQSANGMYGYRCYPDKVKGEGFFIAALRKTQAENELFTPKFKSANDKKAHAASQHLLADANYTCLFIDKENYIALNPEHEPDYHFLNKYVYLRKAGLLLGMPTAKEWVPSHELALSIDKANDIPAIAVNKEAALKFLKKENPELDIAGKGWYLITYNGQALGWIKALGNRYNNYLPKNWRIRMELTDADWA